MPGEGGSGGIGGGIIVGGGGAQGGGGGGGDGGGGTAGEKNTAELPSHPVTLLPSPPSRQFTTLDVNHFIVRIIRQPHPPCFGNKQRKQEQNVDKFKVMKF